MSKIIKISGNRYAFTLRARQIKPAPETVSEFNAEYLFGWALSMNAC